MDANIDIKKYEKENNSIGYGGNVHDRKYQYGICLDIRRYK